MKTADLIGPALDWAVAKAEGTKVTMQWGRPHQEFWINDRVMEYSEYQPSVDWSQGGPIIERERICTEGRPGNQEGWAAHYSKKREAEYFYSVGSTPLIAAMRCYVASKLGDDVEIPEELR